MANQPQSDLRNTIGKPGAPDATPAPLTGSDKNRLDVTDSGEHSVKPIAGDNGGVAEGQVTKSN
jgi:hypothetical protein